MHSSPEAAVAAYFEALNGADAATLASLFEQDGVFIGEGAPEATGADAIRAFAEAAFSTMRVNHEFEIDRVDRSDGLAVVQTHSAGTLTMLAAGTTIENAHRELYVLRDGADGWRIRQYMYNSAEAGAGAD